MLVQQHVKAKDLEAGAPDHVFGEESGVTVLDAGVGQDQRLHDAVLDVAPYLLRVPVVGPQLRYYLGISPTTNYCL